MGEDEKKIEVPLLPLARYTNFMMVSHTPEEFYLDFGEKLPGTNTAQGVIRLVTSPWHMKRILKAIDENVRRYEKKFGEIREHQEVVQQHA